MDDVKEMVGRIRALTKEKGTTVNKMLVSCGLGKSLISDMEARSSYPTVDKLAKISEHLDVTLDFLLGRTDNKDTAEKLQTQESKLKKPLSDSRAAEVLQVAFVKAGLTDENGMLYEDSAKVISDFILTNSDMLKKLVGNGI